MIVRTVLPDRQAYVDEIKNEIPDVVVVADRRRDAMDTFLLGLDEAGDGAALHLEDDIVLCAAFEERVNEVLRGHGNEVVQFFSMRPKKDLVVGSRREPGRSFLMNQCFYLPTGVSAEIRSYADHWMKTPRYDEHPTGYDILMADFLHERGRCYWLHVPSLVQHREGVSLINPRRPKKRQSQTFRP